MKRILFIIVCLAIAGMQSLKAQPSIAALHHAGKVTLYSGAQLQTALDKAVSGDTIYLSEGTFGGDITVDKSNIALIGAGERTILTGYFTLGKSGAVTSNCVVEGLNMTGNKIWVHQVSNCVMSQCQFRKIVGTDGTAGAIADLLISRCFCREEMDLSRLNFVSVINSKIAKVSNYNESTSFTNCNIGYVPFAAPDNYYDDSKRVFTNCIINGWGTRATAINCILRTSDPAGIIRDCYVIPESVLDDNLDCTLDNLSDYLGTDGTVVGIMGGDTPYTLTPVAPHVSEHNIEVDAENQKLNVTLTIEN